MAKRGNLKHCYWSGFYFIYSFTNYFDDCKNSFWKKLEPRIMHRNRYFFEDLDISEKNLNFIRKSMFKVVNEYEGTAYLSKLENGLKMAGKTGTSQVRKITKKGKRERCFKK